MDEKEILAKYSTPGLRRRVLSRYGKKWQLRDSYRMSPDEMEKLLDELYAADAPE